MPPRFVKVFFRHGQACEPTAVRRVDSGVGFHSTVSHHLHFSSVVDAGATAPTVELDGTFSVLACFNGETADEDPRFIAYACPDDKRLGNLEKHKVLPYREITSVNPPYVRLVENRGLQ